MKSQKASLVLFPYTVCRNISCPEDDRGNRKVYSGQAPATSFLELDDNENVREYLIDADGKQRKKPTLVHLAIRKTLDEDTENFSVLNGGVVLVARDTEIDDKGRVMKLLQPSIINGSQTRGELKKYIETAPRGAKIPNVYFQLIVTTDDDLIAEISIARNFQNEVKPISIAGRRGQLDELEAQFRETFPKLKLRKSETDLTDAGYVDTEKLIQVLFALLPDNLAIDHLDETGTPNKVFSYSQKTRCLKMFQTIVDNKDDPKYRDMYKFFLDMAGEAWKVYSEWKTHPAFKGTGLRSIERNGSEIVEVPDGIIFPIVSSLSAFVVEKKSGWTISIPNVLEARELVSTAKQAYQEIAKSNPQTMGKSKACYSTLARVTSIYSRLASK